MRLLRSWLLLLASVIGLGLLTVMGPAQAASGTVSVLPQASLNANGAGVTLQLSLTCPAGSTFSTTASLTQRISRTAAANGSGSSAPDSCSGTPQSVRVGVGGGLSTTSAPPFILNTAFTSVTVQICDDPNDFSSCVTQRVSRTVQLRALGLSKPAFSTPNFSVTLPGQATVEARGAGAIVKVPYQCTSTVQGTLALMLSQRVGKTVLSGFDNVQVVCDSSAQTGVMSFQASGPFWHTGAAFVLLSESQLCDESNCSFGGIAFRTLNLARPVA
jgi:hypothetical protein